MSTDSVRLVAALSRPAAYPEPVAVVSLKETHISWLFLTGRYVYKVKKPVNFGFLDFTTLERRQHFCQEELRLNRRISPQTYLAVVPITEENGAIRVNGGGRVIDYAVQMVELSPACALERMLAENRATAGDMQAIAQVVAGFHRSCETSPEITRLGGWDTLRANWQENFEQTCRYVGELISEADFLELRAYVAASLDARREWFERRAAAGLVRDGHGDLHAAQIFLELDGVHIIDCIEFNERFRYGDVGLDVAFLAMDLDFRGCPDLSSAFIDAYLTAWKGDGLRQGLVFYKAYRAYVRGKVTAFLLDNSQLPGEARAAAAQTAHEYFRLAVAYARLPARPRLFLAAGLMGVGKTTIARLLAEHWRLAYYASDEVRKELAGLAPTMPQRENYGQGIYSPEWTQATYRRLRELAEAAFAKGQSCVLDASFHSAAERRAAAELAQSFGAELWLIHCQLDDSAVKPRLESRSCQTGVASDGRWELYQQQKASWEPIASELGVELVELETAGAPEENLVALLYQIHKRVIEESAGNGS